jgi:hypothetical protein
MEEILGVEEVTFRAPKGAGISDEEAIENVWATANVAVATACMASWSPAFGAKVRNEVNQFVSSVRNGSVKYESLKGEFQHVAYDEAHKEAHGTRHQYDAFCLRLLAVSDDDEVEEEGRDTYKEGPSTPAARNNRVPLTPRRVEPSIVNLGAIDKRSFTLKMTGRKMKSSNAAHTNGFLLFWKAREMVHRSASTQRQELVDALHTIVSKNFHQRFVWDDWVHVVASILNSLETMNWQGTEASIIDGLISSLGLDVINVQMRQNLSDPEILAHASESFLGLIAWIDGERERMTLPPFKDPVHPIASSGPIPLANDSKSFAAQVESVAAATSAPYVKRESRCFNCGSGAHMVNSCPQPVEPCPKCGGKGHKQVCPGKYDPNTRKFVKHGKAGSSNTASLHATASGAVNLSTLDWSTAYGIDPKLKQSFAQHVAKFNENKSTASSAVVIESTSYAQVCTPVAFSAVVVTSDVVTSNDDNENPWVTVRRNEKLATTDYSDHSVFDPLMLSNQDVVSIHSLPVKSKRRRHQNKKAKDLPATPAPINGVSAPSVNSASRIQRRTRKKSVKKTSVRRPRVKFSYVDSVHCAPWIPDVSVVCNDDYGLGGLSTTITELEKRILAEKTPSTDVYCECTSRYTMPDYLTGMPRVIEFQVGEWVNSDSEHTTQWFELIMPYMKQVRHAVFTLAVPHTDARMISRWVTRYNNLMKDIDTHMMIKTTSKTTSSTTRPFIAAGIATTSTDDSNAPPEGHFSADVGVSRFIDTLDEGCKIKITSNNINGRYGDVVHWSSPVQHRASHSSMNGETSQESHDWDAMTAASENHFSVPTVRPDSCANRTYISSKSGFFPNGYSGTTTINVCLASGFKQIECKVGVAVIPVIDDDGQVLELIIPDSLESTLFNHTLISQRQLYNIYGTQQYDNPNNTMTLQFPNGNTTTLDVVNGVYHYRIFGNANQLNLCADADASVDDIMDSIARFATSLSVTEACSASNEHILPSADLEHFHHALGHLHYRAVVQFMDAHSITVTDADRKYSRSKMNCVSCGSFKDIKKSIAKVSVSPPVPPGHTVYADTIAFPKVPGDDVRGKYKIGIIFVDKCTGYTRLYPLKSSGSSADAYKNFVDFLATSPLYAGHCRLHTDRGTEFVNKFVRKVAETFGAVITNTGAECHERIGIVERRVRIVKESTAAVLCGSRLSRHFYCYVAKEILRRRNYLPRRNEVTGEFQTPYSLLMGTDPMPIDPTAFPIIGARCTAIHVRKDKFGSRSMDGIYLGLDEESSGGIIYFPETNAMAATVHFTINASTCINEYVQVEVDSDDIDYFQVSRHIEEERAIAAQQRHSGHSVADYYRDIELEKNKLVTAPVEVVAPLPATEHHVHPSVIEPDIPAASLLRPEALEQLAPNSDQISELEQLAPNSDQISGIKPISHMQVAPKVPSSVIEVIAPIIHNVPLAVELDQDPISPVDEASTSRQESPFTDIARLSDEETDISDGGESVVSADNIVTEPREPRRSGRICTAKRHNDMEGYVAHSSEEITTKSVLTVPKNVAEAKKLPEWPEWQQRMDANLRKYMDMGAITVVQMDAVPSHAFSIKGVWAFSNKKIVGLPDEYKARLTAAGYSMKPWMYEESYAPVGNIGSIRFIVREAAIYDNLLLTADSSAAFQNQLNPNYIHLAWGTPGIPQYDADGNKVVYRLNSTLQGQKDAAELFYSKCGKALLAIGLQRSVKDPCLYYYLGNSPNENIYVVQYVDDFLLSGPPGHKMEGIKTLLTTKLHCKTIDTAVNYLGLHFIRNHKARTITIDQQRYIDDLLVKFGMDDAKPQKTPAEEKLLLFHQDETTTDFEYKSCVPSILFVVSRTRPDIAFVTGVLCRFLKHPGPTHVAAVKRVMRYLVGTKHYKFKLGGIYNENENPHHITMYVDADYASSDTMRRRSVTGFTIFLGRDLMEWLSKMQSIPASSTTYAEYIALHTGLSGVIHWTELCRELGLSNGTPATVFEDNKQCIRWADTNMINVRNRAVEVCYHRIRHYINERWMKMVYKPTIDMIADLLTKPLGRIAFERLRTHFNLVDNTSDSTPPVPDAIVN